MQQYFPQAKPALLLRLASRHRARQDPAHLADDEHKLTNATVPALDHNVHLPMLDEHQIIRFQYPANPAMCAVQSETAAYKPPEPWRLPVRAALRMGFALANGECYYKQ